LKNLYAAIMTKLAGSALSVDVGGRIYYGEAPQGTVFPYVVFLKISGVNADTFTERLDESLIQFSLYSTSKGVTGIGTMYSDLRSLFDDASFTVTSSTLVQCLYQSSTELMDDIVTSTGTVGLKHWPVEYRMIVRAT
jgi:hypothetical protein